LKHVLYLKTVVPVCPGFINSLKYIVPTDACIFYTFINVLLYNEELWTYDDCLK